MLGVNFAASHRPVSCLNCDRWLMLIRIHSQWSSSVVCW